MYNEEIIIKQESFPFIVEECVLRGRNSSFMSGIHIYNTQMHHQKKD